MTQVTVPRKLMSVPPSPQNLKRCYFWDFLGGLVVKNLPAIAGGQRFHPGQEDTTCCRTVSQAPRLLEAQALEPVSHNY